MANDAKLCRVCLKRNTKMYSMKKTKCIELFEKITSCKVNTKDGKPETICYICYFLLQRFRQFRNMSQNSENILTQFLQNGYKLTQAILPVLDEGTPVFSTTPVELTSYDPNDIILTEDQTDIYFDMESCNSNVKSEDHASRTYSWDEEDPGPIVMELNLDESDEVTKEEKIETKPNSDSILKSLLLDQKEYTIVNIDATCSKQHEVKNETLDKVPNSFSTHLKTCQESPQLENTQTSVVYIKNKGREKSKYYACNICFKVYTLESNLIHHMLDHVKNDPFTCDVCDKEYSNVGNLKKHFLSTHSEMIPHVCKVCERVFSRMSLLTEHLGSHRRKKSYACKVCKKAFAKKSLLTSHLRAHSGKKSLVCDVCEKAFTHKTDLISHMKIHSGFSRKICSKNMKVHTEITPFVCEICGKTLHSKSRYTGHMRIHTGEKPFECHVCGKKFTEHTNWKTHKVIHTGEKLYSCDVCGKSFTQNSSLTHHNRTVHLKERRFKCEVCAKSYSTRTHLNMHMRYHTGEKYSCDKCTKTYMYIRHYKRHLKSHIDNAHVKSDKNVSDANDVAVD